MWNLVAGSKCRQLVEDVIDLFENCDEELPTKTGTVIIQPIANKNDIKEVQTLINYYSKCYGDRIVVVSPYCYLYKSPFSVGHYLTNRDNNLWDIEYVDEYNYDIEFKKISIIDRYCSIQHLNLPNYYISFLLKTNLIQILITDSFSLPKIVTTNNRFVIQTVADDIFSLIKKL